MSSKKDTNKNTDSDIEIPKDEGYLDYTLRPSLWDEYIGQENIKENLRILLTAAEYAIIHQNIFFFMDHQD